MSDANFDILSTPILTPDELDYLRSVAARAYKPSNGSSKRHFNQDARKSFTRDTRAFRMMLAILEHPAVAEVVARRTSKPYVDDMDLLIKEANAPETSWHQDRPYWPWDQPASMFTIWVPLADVDRKNGCLRIHDPRTSDVKPHKKLHYGANKEFSALMIDPDQFDLGSLSVREVPLPAGGAIIFDSFTVHSAFANQTDQARVSFKLVIGDLANRKARGGGRVMRLNNLEHEVNRRLGFLPAFAAWHVRDTVLTEGRKLWKSLRA